MIRLLVLSKKQAKLTVLLIKDFVQVGKHFFHSR